MSKRVSSSADGPLEAWGATLRARRTKLRHQRRTLAATGAAGLLLLWPFVPGTTAPRLVWNGTASAPTGLYRVEPVSVLHVGDWVAVAVPGTVRSLAAERRYIPPSIPLLKQIAAGPGETVCASGSHITLEGKQLAVRRHADGNGRPLPWWEGCRTLRPGDIFLLNAASPASFDGRYFGPSPAGDVIGIARPLWLR